MTNLRKGLNSFQVKIIALVFMTIDFIAYHVFIPYQAPNIAFDIFNGLGRIAAPLFLFILVNSAQYTQSKPKLILRLYITGVIMGLLNASSVRLLPPGFFISNNIFPTLMYTVLYIYLVENIVNSLRNKRYIRSICFVGGFLLTYLPIALENWSKRGILTTFPALKENISQAFLVQDIIKAVAPNILAVEYSVIFVLLGITWYFVRNKKVQCGIFILASVLCYCVISGLFDLPEVVYSHIETVWHMFSGRQYLMILALPFIYLYNGEKGKSVKWLFYIYYPACQYLLLLIRLLIGV